MIKQPLLKKLLLCHLLDFSQTFNDFEDGFIKQAVGQTGQQLIRHPLLVLPSILVKPMHEHLYKNITYTKRLYKGSF